MLMSVYLFVEDSGLASESNFFDDLGRMPVQVVFRRLGLHRLGGPRAKKAVQDVAMLLTDQQLVTSASILIVSFVQHCTITQYHFNITNDLAFLAFTTVDSTMRIAASRYTEKGSRRAWRAVWVACVFVSLVISDLVVYNEAFLYQYGMSTQCVWNQLSRHNFQFVKRDDALTTRRDWATEPRSTRTKDQCGADEPDMSDWVLDYAPPEYTAKWLLIMIVFDLLLVWALLSMLHTLYPSIRSRRLARWFHRVIKGPVYVDQLCALKIESLKVSTRGQQLISNKANGIPRALQLTGIATLALVRVTLFPMAVVSITIYGLVRSQLLENMRTFTLIVFSAKDIFETRAMATDEGRQGDEDAWGFGQVLPLLLLALPLTAVLEFAQEAIGKPMNTTPKREDAELAHSVRMEEPTQPHRTEPQPDISLADEENEEEPIATTVAKRGKTPTIAAEEGSGGRRHDILSIKPPSPGTLATRVDDFESHIQTSLIFRAWIFIFAVGIFAVILMAGLKYDLAL